MGMSAEERMAIDLDARKVWGFTDDEEFNRKIARAWKESSFRPEDFAGRVYPREEVAADQEKVARIKKSPDYTHEKSSESVALEYVLMEGIKVAGWFGDNVESVQKTSEYDDMTNGIDFVVTFYDDETGEFVYLGVDATTSADQSVRGRKMDRIFEKLAKGKMGKIKYFEDPDRNAGPIELPRVILALSKEKTIALQKLMVKAPTLAEDSSEKFEFLASAQSQLLKEINYVLMREGFLGEGRDLKSYAEVLRFMAEHGEDLGGGIRKIVSAHADVMRFFIAAAPKLLH